jgi:Fur family peroxide stress response transcriptional regulator
MNVQLEQIKEKLIKHNIRPSFQRIKVLEFLYHHDIHPTVEDIYHELAPDIPSLSKATVYNTLHALVEGGLARVISIDENEMRYEAMIKNHGHFKCESCGCIFNFGIEIDHIKVSDLSQFSVKEKSVYFKGLCPDCNKKQKLLIKEGKL